jgi:hypothetical protein
MSVSIDSNKLSHMRRPPECDLAASMMSSRRKDEFLGEIELVGFLGEIKIQIHGGTHVLADGSRTQYKRKMDSWEKSKSKSKSNPMVKCNQLALWAASTTPSRTRARACR